MKKADQTEQYKNEIVAAEKAFAKLEEEVLEAVKQSKGRIVGLAGFNPLKGMESVRQVERAVKEYGFKGVYIHPYGWGIPLNHRQFYPLYTKCAEMELPLCVNTGIPGPPIPGEVQNPIHLDRVCVRFPELKLCMIHGADPWWDIAIRMLIKYQNHF